MHDAVERTREIPQIVASRESHIPRTEVGAKRMHGRVVRLLVWPLLNSLIAVLGHDPFLVYLNSFRYPLAGEFAVTAMLARSNRIPSDWGLEVGTLAEVFRNTSLKRICQTDLSGLRTTE